MAIYLVAFDLGNENWNYSTFYAFMDEFNPKKLNRYTFLIQTQDTAKDIYNKLRPHINTLDTLFVIKQTTPWHGHGANEIVDWVVERLRKPVARFPYVSNISYTR